MSLKMLESMKDIYVAKLVNWQMEGKDENVECCLKAVRAIEVDSWRYIKIKKDTLVNMTPIFVPEKFIDTEVDNWIKGYIVASGNKIFQKQDYREYLDSEEKKHRLNTKVYYICH